MSSLLLLLLIPATLALTVSFLVFTGCDTTTLVQSPPPRKPTALRLLDIGRTTITLGWLDSNVAPVTFEVERRRDGDVTPQRLLVTAPTVVPDTGELTFVDVGVQPATFYFYQVRAVRISDDEPSLLSDDASGSTLA